MPVVGIQEFGTKQEQELDYHLSLLGQSKSFALWTRLWSLSGSSWMCHTRRKDLVLRRQRNSEDSSSRRAGFCRDRSPLMNHPHNWLPGWILSFLRQTGIFEENTHSSSLLLRFEWNCCGRKCIHLLHWKKIPLQRFPILSPIRMLNLSNCVLPCRLDCCRHQSMK